MRSTYWQQLLGLFVAGLWCGIAGRAQADVTPEDAKAAAALFKEGKKLIDKKPAEACAKLEESYRLDPAHGTLLNLADCHERIGKTASAWRAFAEVSSLARAAGNAEREKVARERAAALVPRLSRIVIKVAAPKTPGIEIKRDNAPVSSAQWDTPEPVDPGIHTIVVTAPHRRAWQAALVVEAGKEETAQVPALEALDDRPTVAMHTQLQVAPASASNSPSALPMLLSQPTQMVPFSAAMTASGVLLAALGTAGLTAGGSYFLNPSWTGVDPNSQKNIAMMSMMIGGIALTGGVLMIGFGLHHVPYTASDDETERRQASTRAAPILVVGPTSLGLQVAF